mgnify:CR=1 FL=1
MTYLTEENQIKVVTCNLPVVGFIDMPNITENSICDANYQVKNAIIKPNAIEEHSIYVEIEMGISAECYEEKEINDHGIREVRRVAVVNNALCQGCGACTVACPSGSMDLQGFSNRQIIAEVDAICR